MTDHYFSAEQVYQSLKEENAALQKFCYEKQAENETLRAGYEAARLEIESLRARSVAPAGVSANRIPLLDERDQGCALVRTTRGWDFRRNGNMIRELNIYERLFVESALAATTPPAQATPSVLEDAAREVLMEHSGCGGGTQVDMLTVRLNPGDRVVMLKGRITQAVESAARKQGANHD